MKRLFVTDVDGTLVKESASTIDPAYFTVIRQLKDQGIQVVLASGRPYSSMSRLFAPVADLLWYLCDGGSTLKTTGDFERLGTIPQDWAKELWADIAKVPQADGMICGANQVYLPIKDSQMCCIARDDYKMKVSYLNGWDTLPPEPAGKISLFCSSQVEEMANQYILPQWKDRLYTVISGEWWLDCMMPGLSKGAGLQKILDDHGYLPEEVLATGDNMNDLEMLQLAGEGLAVETARQEVKAVASGIIPSFQHNGVLEEWKKYLREPLTGGEF